MKSSLELRNSILIRRWGSRGCSGVVGQTRDQTKERYNFSVMSIEPG